MDRAEQVSRRLKLRQLEVLLAVAECGSMLKASQRLAVAQPVISKTIADLEGTLGVRLLDRTPRGVEPTLYGRALIDRSIATLNDLRTAVSELEHLANAAEGELRIGSSDAVASGMLGVIVDRLSRQYPGLRFEMTLGIHDLPYPALRARDIDLVIGRLPTEIPEDIDAAVLYQEESYVVAGAEHPLARRRKVTLADLVDQPWCGPSFDAFPWSLTADMFRKQGLRVPRVVAETRSMLTRYGLLATGRFLTILPRTVLYFCGRRLQLTRINVDMPIPTYPAGITTLKHRTLNPVAQLFIECAAEVARPLIIQNTTSRPSYEVRA